MRMMKIGDMFVNPLTVGDIKPYEGSCAVHRMDGTVLVFMTQPADGIAEEWRRAMAGEPPA